MERKVERILTPDSFRTFLFIAIRVQIKSGFRLLELTTTPRNHNLFDHHLDNRRRGNRNKSANPAKQNISCDNVNERGQGMNVDLIPLNQW